ncbi:Site-specific DNA recombinase [Paenibacillus sp. 1_12]|uniref:recombinase family protein n=1 Tax=Paenibacillus sp. 1_12 TaxID=1566278 RepID=UPI0008F1A4CE|nr:recombinase family protein [Paenibacillus sp. 1_12]SFL20975.1 Site-specific DNA recombinase [Paenibacillus sp. 1_12]
MENNSKVFGYCRISKAIGQVEDRQKDLMRLEYHIPESDIFVDKISGVKMERPALGELQKALRRGDTLVVESLSRISRSSRSLLALLADFESKEITLISHKERLDFSTVTGKLMLALIAALSEFERDNLRERVREGLASARSRGRIGGRPKTDKKALEKAIKLHAADTHSICEIVAVTGVSKSVLYRALRDKKEAQQSQDGVAVEAPNSSK